MGMLDKNGLPGGGANGLPPLLFDVKPRVFVRRAGDEYVEIVGVKSFERKDSEGSDGIIVFGLAEGPSGAAQEFLQNASDKLIDVKMEFLIGMLMVMTFSGFYERIADNKIGFSLLTPIATDVVDVAQ